MEFRCYPTITLWKRKSSGWSSEYWDYLRISCFHSGGAWPPPFLFFSSHGGSLTAAIGSEVRAASARLGHGETAARVHASSGAAAGQRPRSCRHAVGKSASNDRSGY